MNSNDLTSLIKNNNLVDEFENFIQGERYPDAMDIGGISIKFVRSDRQDAQKIYIFECEGSLFRIDGSYDSWNGTSVDDYMSFYEVKAVEKKYIDYDPI